jgi:cytochrome P450
VPLADRDRFEHWAHALLATSGLSSEEVGHSFAELHAYMAELIEQRRAVPTDDLLSGLALARESDDTLADEEILSIAMLLIVGGFDNTANTIDAGVLALLNMPDQQAILLADIDGVIDTAVEEVLRHAQFCLGQPVAGGRALVPLVATEDVDVDGVLVREGEAIHVDSMGCNHDDAVFGDADRFDVQRVQNPHLGLSHGIHHCLGAPLARLELQVAIGSLFRRFPTLALDGKAEYMTGVLTGGMTVLPVRW